METLDPTIKRWYLPQELFREYGRRQWSYTNYARQPYVPYVGHEQEGQYFYDYYGNLVTQGWLVYDWRQTQARTLDSSRITKLARYDSWFHRLIISSDATGDNSYSLTVGDEIFASLTPMTFRKAGFSGVMTDFASSRLRATGLFARPSHPVVLIFGGIASVPQSNYTNLTAARLEADVTDFLTLGATFVNAHNAAGIRDSFQGNPFRGALTTGQLSSRVNLLLVRLRDDSPEDGEGGPILFDSDLEITTSLWHEVDVEGGTRRVLRDTTISGRSIGFYPAIEGGEVRDGFRRADGQHSITMHYTLAPEEGESEAGTLRLLLQRALQLSLDEADEAVTRIRNVRFRLRLANDYAVEIASDRQANRHDIPQFLEVARAAGNVKNQLNPEEVVFDYGLPTATQVAGLTTEIRDLAGFDFYGEFNVSTSVRQYPSTLLEKHDSFSGIVGDEHALGFQVNPVEEGRTVAAPLRGLRHGRRLLHEHQAGLHPGSRGLLARGNRGDLRLRRRQRRPGPAPRSGSEVPRRTDPAPWDVGQGLPGDPVGCRRPGRVPGLRRERRPHLRFQSEQQRRPGQLLPRLRGALPAPQERPSGVSLRNRPRQQRRGRALRERRSPRLPPTRRATGATTPTAPFASTPTSSSRQATCARTCATPTAPTTLRTASSSWCGTIRDGDGCSSSTWSSSPGTRSPTPSTCG